MIMFTVKILYNLMLLNNLIVCRLITVDKYAFEVSELYECTCTFIYLLVFKYNAVLLHTPYNYYMKSKKRQGEITY